MKFLSKHAKPAFVACLLALLWTNLSGQEISIERFQTSNGLSDDAVRSIHQDKFGYLWVSTSHGLNRYDGYSFEIYRYDPADSFSISANSHGTIFEDLEGNIWVSLDVGGIAKLDRSNGRFTKFMNNEEEPSNPNNFISWAHFDSKGRSWLASSVKVNLVTDEKGHFEPVEVFETDDIRVRSIFESSNGKIWLAATEGLFVFDEEEQVFRPIQFNQNAIGHANRIVEDGIGTLWVNTFDKGVYKLDKGAEVVEPASLPSRMNTNNVFKDNESVWFSAPQKGLFRLTDDRWEQVDFEGLNNDRFLWAHSDPSQEFLFVLTSDNEIYLLDPENKKAQFVNEFEFQLTDYDFDKNGEVLWIGSSVTGLYQVSFKYESFSFLEPGESVSGGTVNAVVALAKGTDQSLYFSTPRGLHEYETATGRMSHLARTPGYMINDIIDQGDQILLGTSDGIYEYHKIRGHLKKLDYLPVEVRINETVFDVDGNLWAIGDFGLLKHNLSTDSTLFFSDYEDSPYLLRTGATRKLFIDSEGVVWVGMVREGMFRVQEQADGYSFKRFVFKGVNRDKSQSQTINTLFEDSRKQLWVGGFSSGLLEFDRETEEWVNMTPKGASPIPNVMSIQEDKEGCIWLSAIDGIHKYNPKTGSLRKFGIKEGIRDVNFFLHASTLDNEGYMYFGNRLGLMKFDPESIIPEPISAPVLVESIRIFDEFLTLEEPIQEVKSLEFSHKQNFIGFDFIAVDYDRAGNLNYSYQLEGVDEDWVNNRQSRSVNYANLNPGSYTFKVRSGFNSGNWSDKITSIAITIRAPYWQTWWFYLLVLVFVMATLYGIHQFRLRQKLQRLHFIESVRKKAAADFHDEMGNKLTRIALFSEVLERKLNGTTPEVSDYVAKIKNNSRNLNNSMRDFLWALDPKKDSAYDLATMLKDFGDELFDESGLQFSVERIPVELKDLTVTMDWKRHLVMMFKEGMHNVLKHAQAKNVSLQFAYEKNQLTLELKDDGQGFDVEEKSQGYGLRNMQNRAAELKGRFEIISEFEKGTRVVFSGVPEMNVKI